MITAIVFILVLSFLVLIHEMGHLIAAKLSGVWVHQFSIGFGPDLFSYETKETTYSFKPILFGGYVKMAGEDVAQDEDVDDEVPPHRKFYSQHPLKKMLISFAGSAMNLVAAVLILILLTGFSGVPRIAIYDLMENSPSKGILAPGDQLLSLGGRKLTSLEQINSIIQNRGDEPIEVKVLRDGQRKILSVTPRWYPDEGQYMIGASLGVAAGTRLEVVKKDSVLAGANVRAGDVITGINGHPVNNWSEVLSFVSDSENEKNYSLTLKRNDELREVTVSLSGEEDLMSQVTPEVLFRSIGPLTTIRLGLNQVRTILLVTYQGLKMVVVGKIPAGEAISGPVGIADYLGQSLRQGVRSLFFLIALISLNLGLVNLIPFPALDGSRIGFAFYELVRGKPIPPEKEGLIHSIGFAILIGVLIFFTYQDILKLLQ